MDEQRFDQWARALAGGRSRRQVLRGLLGGLTAGLFANVAQKAEAEAPRSLRNPRALRVPRELRSVRGCRADQSPDCAGQCCPGDTICFEDLGCMSPDEVPCAGGTCPAGYSCTPSGMCLPPGGIECGSGYCESDHVCINGQGCLPPGGTACGSGFCAGALVCVNGQCERACDTGTIRCGGACVDTASNAAHCGGCGSACASGQVCSGGVCACPAGTELCGGECVDLLIDIDHCGACDAPCSAAVCVDASCVDGHCQQTPIPDCCAEDADCDDGNPCTVNLCDPETSTCGSVMVDEGESCPPDTNPCTYDICDGAGQCIHPPIEVARRVVCARPDGFQGICVNGDCVVGGPGPDPDLCDTSTCSNTCCGNDCVNLQTDPLNCGSCGNACEADEACVAGSCEGSAGCSDFSGWYQYPEWEGTFSLTYDLYAEGRHITHEESTATIRLRLTPPSYETDTFKMTSYEGTCVAMHDNRPGPGQQTYGSAEDEISDNGEWFVILGDGRYGRQVYTIWVQGCRIPVTTTYTDGRPSEHSYWSAGTLTIRSGFPLPSCGQPIAGEASLDSDDGYYRTAGWATWSLTPVGP